MAKGIIPTKGGDEHDAFSGWRRFLHWRPGERPRLKRKFNKRVRAAIKDEIRRNVLGE